MSDKATIAHWAYRGLMWYDRNWYSWCVGTPYRYEKTLLRGEPGDFVTCLECLHIAGGRLPWTVGDNSRLEWSPMHE